MAAAALADAFSAVRAAANGEFSALAALASKVLGYGVVAGSAVLKLPQVRPAFQRSRQRQGSPLKRSARRRSPPCCAPAARAA